MKIVDTVNELPVLTVFKAAGGSPIWFEKVGSRTLVFPLLCVPLCLNTMTFLCPESVSHHAHILVQTVLTFFAGMGMAFFPFRPSRLFNFAT